jgi:hypothetical protein
VKHTLNRGFYNGRNTAWRAATGDRVACAEDACPDPHWLHNLVTAIERHDLGSMPVTQDPPCASRAVFTEPAGGRCQPAARYSLTAYLHGIQPIARSKGSVSHGLIPLRRRVECDGTHARTPSGIEMWSARWHSREDWLAVAEALT